MFGKLTDKNILKKIASYYSIDGWLTDREAIGLFSIANKLNRNAIVVEIGSWQGKSTYCISMGLRSGKVYAIDPFNADSGNDMQSRDEYMRKKGNNDLQQVFKDNMTRFGVMNKIIIKQGYSSAFQNEFDTIDFLFIDGDHSIEGCVADFEMYAGKVTVGGYIAFHDYYKDRTELGPTYVIDHLIPQSKSFAFFELYDSLWVGKRTS